MTQTIEGGNAAFVEMHRSAGIAANPKTVVVLNGGGALEMPWIGQASDLDFGTDAARAAGGRLR